MAKYFSSVNNLIHIKENSTNKFITVGNNRENSILNLDDDNINANFRVIDNIWTPQINLNNIESTYDSEIINIGSGNTIIQLNPNVGIGTNNPLVSFDINTTDSIKIPKGDISQRPQDLTENDQGLMRYNTELNKFEGFDGDSWKSLGGVIDNNKDTYITAESNNEDNNELQFYTTGDQRMIIKDDGKIGIGTSNPEGLLDIYESNERIFKLTYDNIEISRSIIPINSNVDIGDPEHQIRDMYVSDNSLWIGDTHKISQSDGKLKFRKRNTSSIPDVIRNLPAYQTASTAVILQAIIDFFNDQTLSVVSNITLKHWLEFYRSQKGADRDISIQEVFRDNADDYEEETAADAWLVSNTNNIYLGNDYTKIGIGTDIPNVSLDLSYKTDAIKLPKGNNSTRDSINANTIEDQGLIRYNTESKQFEGFGAGNAWGSLGGVIDIDQDTYITAETNATDNDELQFYTTGDERMIIKSDGKIGLNVSEPSHQVHIKGNTRIEGDLIVNGTQHIIDTDTSTTEQIIVTNDGTGPALIVNQIGAQPIVDIQDDSNSILFIENGGNIGIKTTNPSVSFEINTTDSIKIPKGDIEQRPKNLTENDQGLIRYNTELYQFEGFGSGNAWGSLGGVIDVDQDTYIRAESNNEDNDELQFYTTGDERMIIKSDGKIGIGISEPLEQLHITGNIKIIGNILNDNLDFRFANIENIQLKTLLQPNLVSAKAINIDTTITGGLDNSTDNLKIKHQGITNDHILNGTIDLTQKVISNLPIVNGGTGANTANNARTNLGLAIGTNVQAYSAKLQSIANLAASASKIPMFSGLTDVTLLDFVDDEEMLGDSATAIPSQRSVKKYVDSLAGFLNIIVYTLHGSNLNCNVELLPPDADATLTLNSDYSIAGAEGTEQFTTFVSDVSEDIAVSLGVESDSIIVTEVTEGSLIVEFTLKPSKIDSNFNPSQAVIGLKQTLEDPSSSILTNSKFLSQAVIVVPPEVVAQALDPTKIFITLDNDKEKVIDIAKYFKGEFITYELLTNPHDNVNLNTTLQQITILGAFRDTSYDIKINATKGDTLKLLIFNITEPEPLPPIGKDAKKIVLSNTKKQINLRDKFKGSYLEIFEIEQNPYNNVTLIDNSNMIYEIEGSFRDTNYSIIFKATQNAGDLLSAYWTLNVKELPLIPKKLLPNIDNLIITTGQVISYNLDFVFIGAGLVYGFITNPYSDNIYITNNILYITENQRGITYDIEVFGKNLSQTLIWKITLTEDLPPAPIVIGVEESNFITSDILSYDLTTLFTGLNITYDIEYYYNIGGSTYPPIDNFFIQNKPWARYHSKNWNKHLNRIVDTSGYNRPSVEVLSGNINSYATYISGDKNASLKIPMPNTDNWTVCFAVKYNGANKGTIISGDNTILGNWNGFRGFVQLGGEILTKIENIGSSDDWVILCVKTNGTAPNNIKLNGVSIGTEICEIPLDCLYVNRDLNSDWIFSDFVIWDYELDISQSTIISDIFIQHIAGTTNALNNDLQPVDMHSLYNNYNFDNNVVTISGNNRGTSYDIYVVAINAKNNAKWKLEITEGSGTRSENISLTTGLYEYNIKHLFSSNVYDTKLSVNNENFYSITGDILTFYPNYRNIEYGLIINSANEQYIFNIKEETGVAPRSFSANNFHLIDNRVIEYIDVIGANATVDNTIVIESTTVLYFPENMISSLLLIDNNKYYYINNIVLNGIYQIKCDLNDIKILDNTLNVKYSSLSNGIAIDTTVDNLLTDVFSVADASSNPKFVLKYTPYEKVTILNNFVNLVSTVDVNPEFDSGSANIITGSTYSYSSDNNFTANFTEQFDNCHLLLIDNNKYYYNSNVSLDGNKQFTLSANNVELVGSAFNSGTDGEVIDLTNVNTLITNVFGSDQIISSGSTGTIDTTNMLVWYKFDDDLIDSSGNGNSLIVSSVSTPTLTESGITGNALKFQNNIDTTTITNGLRDGTCKIPSIDLVDKEFSISFWIKLLNNFDTDHSGIFMLGYNEGLQTDGYIKLSCAYYESKNNIDFYYKNNLSDEGGNASTDLSIDTWYNIIITITNSHLKVYTNNILTSTNSLAEGLPDVIYDTNYLGFYADSTYTNTKDDFIIDDFRIYDKALTAQEISDIYNDTEPLVGGSTNYTPIQRVFLKYTTIVKTIEPSIVDTIYLHPVNTTPILITNDEYYIEIKSTNIIYLPKTYANAEILIIGSTKYVKYENVLLNEFATITIDNDLTTISVNNNNYDLTSGTIIDTALTTELNTYNITEHNNITKVLIKYTTSATTKVTNVVFKDQEYLNVLDYATSLQITNNNITYNENDLKISSNVVNDFDNYFTETIQATNEYGTSSLDYNFIKLGYDGVIVPNLENVSKDIYILNTIANIDLREIAIGKKYELIFNPYYFQNNIELIDTTLTLTTNERGIYDILVSIDNKLYVLRIHEFINELENSFYI